MMASSNRNSSMVSNYQSYSNNSLHQNQVVVVVIAFPAQGHLNQLLHLSGLISSYSIPVHYVCTPTHIHQAILRVQGWDPKSISNIYFHDFEAPPFISPPPNPHNAETKFPSHMLPSFEASSHLREPVASLLLSLSSEARRVIVIHDSLMAYVAQDANNIANAENYTFHSTSAFTTFIHLWSEIGRPDIENCHVPETPSLEGCFSEADRFLDFVRTQFEFQKFSDGYIFNTNKAIEGPYIDLMDRIVDSKKHWALGPFNPLFTEKKASESKEKHFSIEWLDKQEPKSVIYVSFGTTTTFTEEEINEIAIGLEQSKQKFILVVRDADKGNIFDGDEAPRHLLLDGFEERVEGLGIVIRDWAPQLEILSHHSVGGFMSHCGWNSCMESLSMGVPIVAWPMHSDQPRNSVLISEVLKVGLVVREWTQRGELVTASVIENAVRKLMATKEGDEMRQKALDLRDAILKNGREMDPFIAHITR